MVLFDVIRKPMKSEFSGIRVVVYGDSSNSQGNTEFAALDYSANVGTGKKCCGTIIVIPGKHTFRDGDLILLKHFVFQKQPCNKFFDHFSNHILKLKMEHVIR